MQYSKIIEAVSVSRRRGAFILPIVLSGFTGMLVRRHVRSEVQDGALAGPRHTKQLLERPR